jgi:outer membrane protein assembly factor BamE (lipoprotein component of BamABCDE complex)
MPLRAVFGRVIPVVAALSVAAALGGCATGNLGLTTTRTQGYVLSDDALAQVRVGQSKELVTTVLGTPQTTSSFNGESAFYYVQTKVERTAFGLTTIKDRKVVAVYFGTNGKVSDKAIYGLQDGRAFAIESRRTPSFGEDRSFVESLLSSI